ncbi:MAG TPA: hypothetical protein VNP73_07315 [Actinomycetota bacterium]|nr:hypothetical protein [Actinomycetota bacterium]
MVKALLALVAIAAIAVLGEAYGYLRSGVAVIVFFALASFGFKYWRDVGLIPPEPEQEDVRDQQLRYVCRVCGLQLRVEISARDRAPTHCAEPMELVKEEPRTPLRPV